MFDARSILDVLVRGGAPQGPGQGQGQQVGQQGGLDAFSDLLGQLAGGDRPPSGQQMPRGSPPDDERYGRGPQRDQQEDLDQPRMPPRPRGEQYDPAETAGRAPIGGAGSLEDLLRSVLGGGQGGPGGGGNLQDILRDFLGGAQGSGGTVSRLQDEGAQGQGSQGSVLDVLKQVLGQATSGVREGAGRLDEMTGASGRARDAIGQATGRSPDELIAKLRELVANNQLGAGAALGGLGALILGTGTGRSLAASAVKLGGLALIGGLAYKAYQNYQQGQPPLTGRRAPAQQALAAAPEGSGFEAGAITNETATRYIRAMIAAAAMRRSRTRSSADSSRPGSSRPHARFSPARSTIRRRSRTWRPASPRSRRRCRSTPRRALPSVSTPRRSTRSWRSWPGPSISTRIWSIKSTPLRAARPREVRELIRSA